MGALPGEEATHFRVWAPNATGVAVVGDFNDWNAQAHPLQRAEDGLWAGEIRGAKPGQSYQYEIVHGGNTFRKNDPYAREINAERKTSVIYADTHAWKSPGRVLAHWNEIVIYELHCGTFAAKSDRVPGRFEQAIERLPYLKNLGVNVVEVMPPMSFPSERSWGYNLTYPFAVEASYGGPDALKKFIDAAHGHGIAVIMDVVLNHFGPDDLDLWRFDGWSENNKGGIYFYNDQRSWTPWGENRPDYNRGEVRQYLRDYALLWLDEFHVDGLRADGVAFIRDTRGEGGGPETALAEGWSLLQWINDEVQRFFAGALTIAEDLQQNHAITRPIREGGMGFGMQWDSGFVYPLRHNVIYVNDNDRNMDGLAQLIRFRYNEDAMQRVIYSESHDDVANGKARIPQEIDPHDPHGAFAQKRSSLAAGVALTSPGIPMIFEGQEFLETGWFQDDKALDWSQLKTYRGINRLYRDLLHLRRNLDGTTRGLIGPFVHMHHVNNQDKVIAYHRWEQGGPKDDVIVIASFKNQAFQDYKIGFPRGGRWMIRFNSDWKGYSPEFNEVESGSGEVLAGREEMDGCQYSGRVSLPAYSLLILSQDETKTVS